MFDTLTKRKSIEICIGHNIQEVPMHTHAEIEYTYAPDEERVGLVHSDACPRDCKFENIDADDREFYHALLDEWLDRSGGTGFFYIGNHEDLTANFTPEVHEKGE